MRSKTNNNIIGYMYDNNNRQTRAFIDSLLEDVLGLALVHGELGLDPLYDVHGINLAHLLLPMRCDVVLIDEN